MTTIFNSIKDYVQPQPKGNYGLEIEAEFKALPVLDVNERVWYVKQDGSLRKNGLEFVSKKPLTKEESYAALNELLDSQIFTKHYYTSPRTSTHIHVNAQNWSKTQLLNVLFAYYLFEAVFMKIAGRGRIGNLFCLTMREAPEISKAVKLVIQEDWKSLANKFDIYKYSALNLATLTKFGTIEFRAFKGTNDKRSILIWLNLIDELCSNAIQLRDYEFLWDFWLRNKDGLIEFLFPRSHEFVQAALAEDKEFLLDYNTSLVRRLMIYDDLKEYTKDSNKILYKFKSEEERDSL